MTRTWAVDDRIAERLDGTCHLGTVVGIDGHLLAIRFDDGGRATFRSRNNPRLHDPDDVPIDERHWVADAVRDQLVRQEAAGRLREMVDVLGGDYLLEELADDLDDLTGGFDELRAAAARALLAPAPQPATTPTTEGVPA